MVEAQMTALRRLGLSLSWPWITSVFLFDIAVLVLASHLPAVPRPVAWWLGVAIATVVTIAVVLSCRGVTLASVLACWATDWFVDVWHSSPYTFLSTGCTPTIDHRRRFGRDAVGVREHHGQLVAVIALKETADAPARGRRRQTVSPATLPVATVAAALRQFDVRLEDIDIVSVRRQRASDDTDRSPRPTVNGRPSAGPERGTWLVLRMDPQHNVAAVAARDSVASTLAAAAERLAGELQGRRCTARPLTGAELAELDTAVAAGLRPASARPGWRHLHHVDGYATSFWVSPRHINSATLDWYWLREADATVVTVRLSAASGRAEVSAWVRYHTGKPMGKHVAVGLHRLTGRQLAAVRASLPTPRQHAPLVAPTRSLRDDEQLEVRVVPIPVSAPQRRLMRPELSVGTKRAAPVSAHKVPVAR